MEIINAESERLTRLIDDLLSLSRLQLDKETFNLQQVDVTQVVKAAINSVSPLLREKSLKIREYLPAGVPPVFSDHDKLMQIMNNLLGNAIKFSNPHGDIQVDIQEVADNGSTNKKIRISITDDGPGIAPEYQDKIFSKFKSADSLPQGVPHGTGLGLAICRETISRLGGHIWVESILGKGSTFYFTLPVESKHSYPLNQNI